MINKLIGAVLMAATVLLSGCSDPKQVVNQTLKEYEIVEVKGPIPFIRAPRPFRVSIRDVESGHVYESQNVARHCHAWKRLEIGSKWKFTEVTYKDSHGNVSYEVDGVRGLCDLLKAMPDKPNK